MASHQQIRALGHADDQMQVGAGQVVLELAHEARHRFAQQWQLVRIELTMT